MEEKIREIVSQFIKVPAGQIAGNTPIDRAAVKSSILLHRMYARLGEEGVVVTDYASVKVFGDLLRRQDAGVGEPSFYNPVENQNGVRSVAVLSGTVPEKATPGIGIDIEEISALPRVADLRKELFYSQNFTPAEISYCILQADPYASLTGLFAAKEAIVKADGQYRNRPFHTLEIGHTTGGKPEFPGFGLSISHGGGMAVAVAVSGGAGMAVNVGEHPAPASTGKAASANWLTWIALLLAAAALLLALKH